MTKARVLQVVGAVALALSVALITSCTGEQPKGPVSPGVTYGSLGGVEVVGYLARAEGAWTVYDANPAATDGAEPDVLAILISGSVDEGGIEALDGRYIWAAGRSSDSGSDPPKIKVDGIDTAIEPL